MSQFAALSYLLLLGALALAGPYGVLSWGENLSVLDRHQKRLMILQEERDELQNRVTLLDPDHADPDLVGEILRENLNVAHPDEYVLQIEEPG